VCRSDPDLIAKRLRIGLLDVIDQPLENVVKAIAMRCHFIDGALLVPAVHDDPIHRNQIARAV
jgi:hypothetical protein